MKDLFNQDIPEIKISFSTKVLPKNRKLITSSKNAFDVLQPFFMDSMEHKELFFAIFMNRANKVLGVYTVSSGGTAGTVADPKIIFQAALKAHSSTIVLSHNHPSGNLRPSEADIKLTNKLKSAGQFLDMPVVDHLIMTTDGYFSFADEGMM